jgi:hypothetical protein
LKTVPPGALFTPSRGPPTTQPTPHSLPSPQSLPQDYGLLDGFVCYVTEPQGCGDGATPSNAYPGAAWRLCDPATDAPAPSARGAPAGGYESMEAVLSSSPDLALFTQALNSTGLLGMLGRLKEATVFAPNDAAMAAAAASLGLPSPQDLLKSPLLTPILLLHVAPGLYTEATVGDGVQADTLSPSPFGQLSLGKDRVLSLGPSGWPRVQTTLAVRNPVFAAPRRRRGGNSNGAGTPPAAAAAGAEGGVVPPIPSRSFSGATVQRELPIKGGKAVVQVRGGR